MRLTLKLKLAAVFVVLIAISSGALLIAVRNLATLNASLEHIVTVSDQKVQLIEEVRVEQMQVQRDVREHILSPEASYMQDLEAEIAEARSRRGEVEAQLEALADDAELQLLAQYKEVGATLRGVNDRVIALSRANNPQGAYELLSREGPAPLEAMEAVLQDLLKAVRADMDAGVADAQQIYTTSRVTLFAVLGLVALLGAGSATWILVSLSRGLNRAVALSSKVAEGDLTETAEVRGRDEIADLLGALNAMVAALRDAAQRAQTLEAEVAERNRLAAEEAARAQSEQEHASAAFSRALGRLVEGDLTARVDAEVSATYAAIKRDLNAGLEKVRAAFAGIGTGVGSIRSMTSEIATAAEDLSRRTESQAANLEETAAAVEEITATVKAAADSSAHARQVVSATKLDAEKSGEVVGRAVEAMNAIEASSRQISQIIGVIDEIAFQTNLLALNAGVEAARAGEAGRGFAVVATEVRALAQRSAEAAKQIKDLISASTTQVDQGVDLVGETGHALRRIVAAVAEINELVSGIAAGAAEQSTGLAQVNVAIVQMDKITQQNAAMVEETTAAVRSLASQTEEVAQKVDRFRTGGNTGAGGAGADEWAQDARADGGRQDAGPRGSAGRARQEAPRKLRVAAGAGAARPAAQDDGWQEF